MLFLFCALSRRVGASEIFIIIINADTTNKHRDENHRSPVLFQLFDQTADRHVLTEVPVSMATHASVLSVPVATVVRTGQCGHVSVVDKTQAPN